MSTFGKIGARSLVWKPPYDAEVDYLESTGAQYIDFPTQGIAGAYYGISGHITITKNPTNNRPFFDTNVSNQFYSTSYSAVSGGYMFGSVIGTDPINGGYSFTIGNKTTFIVSTEGRTVLGVFDPLPRQITQNFSTFRLFKRLATSGNNTGAINVRLHDIKIFSGSTLEHDLIPVRCGSTGYLFDRANIKGGPLGNGLYPNTGTGAFILGPDKVGGGGVVNA